MSSSTSSSDLALDAAPAWGRWLATFVATLGLAAALVSALILIVDPYDSGFGLLGIKGVDDASPRTANASRARDPQFDSAVIGNSTDSGQPSELSQLTGARFVQLTTPGTGPREQLAMMDYFVRHHPRVGALAITADAGWCLRDPALPQQHPFPFWLYGESRFDYVTRMFSSRALRHAGRRLMILAGRRQPNAADGYWDYEKEGAGEFAPVIAPRDDGGRRRKAEREFPRSRAARRGAPQAPRRCSGAVRSAGVLQHAAKGGTLRRRRKLRARRRCASCRRARAPTSSISASTMR